MVVVVVVVLTEFLTLFYRNGFCRGGGFDNAL